MPPAAEAVRPLGDAVMAYRAWRRRPAMVVAGLAVMGLGWSHGLLRWTTRTRPTGPSAA